MEAGPFDDFPDFSPIAGGGCGSSGGLPPAAHLKGHADARGNFHSIQVMLGLQHGDMFGAKLEHPPPPTDHLSSAADLKTKSSSPASGRHDINHGNNTGESKGFPHSFMQRWFYAHKTTTKNRVSCKCHFLAFIP